MKAVSELNKKENVTVVLITHYMEEVIHANKVYVMDGGNVVMQGTPREIFFPGRDTEEIPAGCAPGDIARPMSFTRLAWTFRKEY